MVSYIDFQLWQDLVLGWFAVSPITFTARPIRQGQLDCPGCSHLVPRVHFWSLGFDFGAPLAPTWSPRLAQTVIPFERGIDIHKTHFSNTI